MTVTFFLYLDKPSCLLYTLSFIVGRPSFEMHSLMDFVLEKYIRDICLFIACVI